MADLTPRADPTHTPGRLPRTSLVGARTGARWAAVIAGWGFAVLILAETGLLSRVPLRALPVVVVVGIVAPIVVVRRSPALRAAVATTDLANLTWFNVWRIPAAAAFFAVGAQGLLPDRFVTNAAWGDLVAGTLAPLVVWAGTRLTGRARRSAYLAFHTFSFADFVVAVGTGLTFTLLGDPLMNTLLDTPMALIPLWGVPLTGAVSLLALHRLLSEHRTARS